MRSLTLAMFVAVSAHADDEVLPSLPTPAKQDSDVTATSVEPAPAPLARVHVVSPARVVLQRRDEGGNWRDVCASPCDVDVPIGDGYRVIGARIAKPVDIHAPYVELEVDPPSDTGKAFGGIGIGAGALTALIGLGMIGQGDHRSEYDCEHPTPSYPDTYGECVSDRDGAHELMRDGVITLLAGAAVAALGTWLFVASSRASVTATPHERSASVATRRPTWRSASSSAESALRGPPPMIPLVLEGRF